MPGAIGPPTPKAGPVKPMGIPLPAGLLVPGPDANAVPPEAGPPPGALCPNREDGSAGGGPSTVRETTCVPRTMVRPRVRLSSISISSDDVAPGAAAFFFCLTLRNSSVSASTRFMCWKGLEMSLSVSYLERTLSNASICPASCLPSSMVARIR